MKKRLSLVLCTALLGVSLLTGCSTDKKYTEEEYQANYDTGYDAGYQQGIEDGIAQDRSGQVQTMDYETFKALNEQNDLTCVIYVGRAECPYCSLVTDYMRSVTDLPLPVFYVSLEPYYNSPYYDDFKAELGIDGVPMFIYYKDGKQAYIMDSPVTPGYFEESGQDRVDAYNLMAEKISAFIMGCADDNPEAVEEFDKEHEAETAYDDGSEEETIAAEETTEAETTAAE